MYIKKTFKKDSKTKKTYSAFHLVESIRTDRGPRQRVLLYMGTEIKLPDEQHKLLAECIENIVKGIQSLFPYPEDVEKLARVFASQIVRRLSKPEDALEHPEQQQHSEFVTIDAHTIEQSEPRSVGGEHLMLKMVHQLELTEQLKNLGFSKTEIALAIGTVIARALHPSSEREAYRWLCKSSGLGELLDFDFNKTSLDKLYQISDKLLTHKNTLETALETIEQRFHGYKNAIVLYDLTNTYMEGQAKANPKATHGLSKEKRTDCPLITMGLVVNEHGFISKTSFLPGNASEPQTLQSMIEALSVHETLFKPTIVLDAGIATGENLDWLRHHGYMYVVSARQNAPVVNFQGQLSPVGDRHGLVKATIINQTDSEEAWLYCESEAKAAVASSMKQKFKRRFEEDLIKLADGLSKPKGRKKYAKVLERIGRLKEKHKRISGCYEVKAIPSDDGLTTMAVEWKVLEEKMEEKLTGSYFLRTNRTDLNAKELWQLYNTLRCIEDVFRFMKSSLGLRPVYHQKGHRVDGHLWITVLAYHLIHHCTYQLSKQKIVYQWQTVRNIMMPRVRVTMRAKTADSKMLYHRSTTKAEGEQLEIYRALGLSSSILRSQKTLV
jgi:transposase